MLGKRCYKTKEYTNLQGKKSYSDLLFATHKQLTFYYWIHST